MLPFRKIYFHLLCKIPRYKLCLSVVLHFLDCDLPVLSQHWNNFPCWLHRESSIANLRWKISCLPNLPFTFCQQINISLYYFVCLPLAYNIAFYLKFIILSFKSSINRSGYNCLIIFSNNRYTCIRNMLNLLLYIDTAVFPTRFIELHYKIEWSARYVSICSDPEPKQYVNWFFWKKPIKVIFTSQLKDIRHSHSRCF